MRLFTCHVENFGRLQDLDLCSVRVGMGHGRGEEGQGKEKRKSKENTLQSFRFHRNLLKR